MRLRLKEDPREWMKFTAVAAVAVTLVALVLQRKGVIHRDGFLVAVCISGGAVLASLIRARWFRGFYRAGMTLSWHIGQIMGQVILTVFFFLAVVPIALALRLAGKDLLTLRKPTQGSYWRSTPKASPFDRQF